MDWLAIFKLSISLILLSLASVEDWRSREASDKYWLILGGLGLLLLGVGIMTEAPDPLYVLILVPTAVLFLDIFWDRPSMLGKEPFIPAIAAYVAAALSIVVLIILFQSSSYLWQLFVVPLMIVAFIVFYQFDVIKGGADAKALISLAILFPTYPIVNDLPLIGIPNEASQLIFPFSLLVLFNAALIMIFLPLYFLIFNASRRDLKFPAMFFGYKMKSSEARRRYVWPMEKMQDGKKVTMLMPKDDEASESIYDDLEKAGHENLWVTPKVPFLIPITISLLFSAIIGNLIFLLFAI